MKRRQLVFFLAALLLLGGCNPPAEPDANSKAPAGLNKAPTDSKPFPSILSTEQQSDTSKPMSSIQAATLTLVDNKSRPDGFRSNTVVVSDGLGSFRIATPKSYTVPWRFGTPTDELLAEGSKRDQAWTEFWKDRLTDDDNPRAILLDSEVETDMVGLQITLTSSPRLFGDELAKAFAEMYREIGKVGEHHAVIVNGSEGAYVEYTVPASLVGGTKDRVQLQVLIPDQPNDVLWGVTCDVPSAMVDEIKPLCARMAATFVPLPPIEIYGGPNLG